MELKDCIIETIHKSKLENLLMGESDIIIESSEFSPEAGQIDIGKLTSKGIYKAFYTEEDVKEYFTLALVAMAGHSDYGLYMSIKYLASQLFKEKVGLSPFVIEKKELIKELRINLDNVKHRLNEETFESNTSLYQFTWSEVERLCHVIHLEYDIKLM
ncbi:hypothetical protein MKL26_00320 [Streptococcus suis]|nr:hypothetical protein [Streptococcus suis]